jgi:hypothetical protein
VLTGRRWSPIFGYGTIAGRIAHRSLRRTQADPSSVSIAVASARTLVFPNSPFHLYQPFPPAGDQPEAIEKLVEGIGSERVLYGTDLPWFDPMYPTGCVAHAAIGEEDKRNILYRNAMRLFSAVRERLADIAPSP